MNNKVVITGAVLICLAIIFGAFGAHGLEGKVEAKAIESWKTGSTYQMYCGFGLLILGLVAEKFNFNLKSFLILNLIGVILFSGGIYIHTFSAMVPALKPAVYFVPLGGFSMIFAWATFIILFIRRR
ncbi:MAG: DUF423 domain-containing protein [Flavobacteriales bacterium]|nr:DUF423 domain-containing protein [Flavobacteriales bacterium]